MSNKENKTNMYCYGKFGFMLTSLVNKRFSETCQMFKVMVYWNSHEISFCLELEVLYVELCL